MYTNKYVTRLTEYFPTLLESSSPRQWCPSFCGICAFVVKLEASSFSHCLRRGSIYFLIGIAILQTVLNLTKALLNQGLYFLWGYLG